MPRRYRDTGQSVLLTDLHAPPALPLHRYDMISEHHLLLGTRIFPPKPRGQGLLRWRSLTYLSGSRPHVRSPAQSHYSIEHAPGDRQRTREDICPLRPSSPTPLSASISTKLRTSPKARRGTDGQGIDRKSGTHTYQRTAPNSQRPDRNRQTRARRGMQQRHHSGTPFVQTLVTFGTPGIPTSAPSPAYPSR